MKEAIIYCIIAISSLILMGYTVHMFVGGLVSERTETMIMIIVISIGATAIGFMAWDVIRRRRGY